MVKILVCGGAGYIGSHMVKRLVREGYGVLVYDNLSTGFQELVTGGEFIEGDLADAEKLRDVFANYRIDTVMHFSASALVEESVARPRKYFSNNVINTLNLLDAMLDARVPRFIFSSSAAVYGIPEKVPIGEDHPQRPINPYGLTKLMVENVLREYARAYGLRFVSLRYFNAAGADPEGEIGEMHEPETHLIPLAFRAARGRLKALKIYGGDYPTADGTCVRDYIHVSDLAGAHLRAMEYLAAGGAPEIFNLGNGSGFSVRQVTDTVKQVTGIDFPVETAARRPGDPPVLVADSRKAKTVLGWRPEFPDLKTIVATAWKWEKSRQF